ncbi:MAG TPA: DNA polymerase IV [Candidatus Sulfobium mesophilum]|nr:DNA polymerase IV [Candidatus Sulfobium mesophilum]
MRRILHIDMDAFFAAVEQGRRSELKGKPVVIGGGGDPAQRGVVSTASYEARKYGIHSAMPLRTAYKLCPQAIFLPVDYKEYSRVSEIIKNGLREITPLVEDVGIDEAFLDISEIEGSGEDISGRIKNRIMQDTALTCSIGIGPNKLLAKIASDMRKPDGLTIISESDIEAVIYPLPARKLWGVGPKTEAYLKGMNINTIGELSATPLEKLIGTFGNSYGQFLYDSSRGVDESPLVTHWEPRSCSRETTFQHDTDNWQMMARGLAELTKAVVEDLKRSGYKAKNITAKVRFSDFKTVTRAKTLKEATDSLEEIRRTVFECFGRIDLGMKVRLIGVRAGKLERVGEQK